ncbi:MAG: arylsulfatase [Planctomycetota bacterium]
MANANRPNVIVIMSDDQGVGDYGFLGNPIIRTPHLDAMAKRGGLLNNFYVSPVCAPTRACLMTGRYNYRTRCIDTYIGRAMMDPSEYTIAESLKTADYQTGIFGKWHLGDNYPMRAMDQGFDESLVHRGGGIGQPSDPVGAERKYTNPTLMRNGVETQMQGYCTDIYFDAATRFIESAIRDDKNFFAYIATNAPHGPFHDVPQTLYEQYLQVDFTPILVAKPPKKRMKAEFDKLARISAMITNIDDNVGRLFVSLKKQNALDNTIVVYLNDNGPNTMRYVGKMRGMKSEVDDGGIRSPLLFHWPARVQPGKSASQMTAHIDLMPTLLDACNVPLPADRKIDGRSFLPLLTQDAPQWPSRQIVLQTHRGNTPQRFHHFALHETPWKLVHPSGFGKQEFTGEPKLQLYNLREDPGQTTDLAQQQPQVLRRLTRAYEAWFEDVSNTRPDNYAPPRIVIGTRHEPKTVLTRQDWRHAAGRPWGKDSNGFWLLNNPDAREFQIEVIMKPGHAGGDASIIVTTEDGTQSSTDLTIVAGEQRGHMATVQLPLGDIQLQINVHVDGKGGKGNITGPHQVVLR